MLLLVVSETGLVYTFTTPKLQPLVTKPEGKNLIQACLHAPDKEPTPVRNHYFSIEVLLPSLHYDSKTPMLMIYSALFCSSNDHRSATPHLNKRTLPQQHLMTTRKRTRTRLRNNTRDLLNNHSQCLKASRHIQVRPRWACTLLLIIIFPSRHHSQEGHLRTAIHQTWEWDISKDLLQDLAGLLLHNTGHHHPSKADQQHHRQVPHLSKEGVGINEGSSLSSELLINEDQFITHVESNCSQINEGRVLPIGRWNGTIGRDRTSR